MLTAAPGIKPKPNPPPKRPTLRAPRAPPPIIAVLFFLKKSWVDLLIKPPARSLILLPLASVVSISLPYTSSHSISYFFTLYILLQISKSCICFVDRL